MAKKDYLPANDREFATHLSHFAERIGRHASTLGLSESQVNAIAADARYYDYAVSCQESAAANSKQWTSWRKIVRSGDAQGGTAAAGAAVFPAAVPPVEPGVEIRFRKLVQTLKSHANYNEAIGEQLGIEGVSPAGPDLSTIQPEIEARITGNRVEIDWGWSGHADALDLCEIQVDRGQGFQLLTFDTTPGYIDSHPLPAQPAKWTYRAIYRVGDDQVGQWSKPVTVLAG